MNDVEGGERPLRLRPTLELLRQIWWLNHALERVSSRMSRTLGITAQQRMLLCCAARHPGLTAGRLARELHLDPGTVSTTLARLEDKGLVMRRADRADHRRALLELTPEGMALARSATGTVEHAVERLRATTSAHSLAVAREVLDQLTSLLEAEADREP